MGEKKIVKQQFVLFSPSPNLPLSYSGDHRYRSAAGEREGGMIYSIDDRKVVQTFERLESVVILEHGHAAILHKLGELVNRPAELEMIGYATMMLSNIID